MKVPIKPFKESGLVRESRLRKQRNRRFPKHEKSVIVVILAKGVRGCLPFTQSFRRIPDFILENLKMERMRSICLVLKCSRLVPRVSAQHGSCTSVSNMAALQLLLLIDELFEDDLNMMEDEDDTIVFLAISTSMIKDLRRNENFAKLCCHDFHQMNSGVISE